MSARPATLVTIAALAAIAASGWRCAGAALGAGAGRTGAHATPAKAPAAANTAPDAPPFTGGQAGASGASGDEEATAAGASAGVDPLVSNGLGSPTCKGALGGELSQAARRNCQTSGFVAAPAPTGNYDLDVHIDTGVLGFGSNVVPTAVQDIVITPVWMGLVWVVHALVVTLEWCFSLDLLDSTAALGLDSGLRGMQASFTEPWLPLALACASLLAAYNGLIRRRVAQTLGEALLMGAMMAGGLWIIADPGGTVGALGRWADQASLGTLAVAAHGTPSQPGGTLEGSLGALFATSIEAPWCYLEFGDVSWCDQPARLDPSLRAAGLKIAAAESAQLSCQQGSPAGEPCTPATGAQAQALARSAELLRQARTNGAIFLALPANGVARNSINEQGSLLRTLCQSSEATSCRGPTAAQAEFRTAGQTLARLGGLLLIAGGLLGMLLLLGFLAVRLLIAAIFSLLYLLLAPAMVLAPAFGERGRALFRRWGGQLLGAVVSKLVFAFLLGAVLAVIALLSGLTELGWWTQWLLMSAFWWGAYVHRHEALGSATAALGAHGSSFARPEGRSSLGRVGELLRPRARVLATRWARESVSKRAPEVERKKRARVGRELAAAGADEQVRRMLEHEHRGAREHAGQAAAVQRELTARRAQLARIVREHAAASATGDRRRAAEMAHRGERVRAEVERRQAALKAAQLLLREGERAHRRTGVPYTSERLQAQDRFLDAQAALPAGGRASRDGERRDYAALAGLAGLARAEYERLDPRRRRSARSEIDRELALRRELRQTADALAADTDALPLGARERRRTGRQFDAAVRRRMQQHGHRMPSSRLPGADVERRREAGPAAGAAGSAPAQSSVMRDAHEVAARRKRQLGRDRP